MPKTVGFIWKRTCSICRAAHILLLNRGVKIEPDRDLNMNPMTPNELDALIGKRDYTIFLEPNCDLFRELDMRSSPPPRGEALKLMAHNTNLIRRPILLIDGQVLIGFDEKRWKELLH